MGIVKNTRVFATEFEIEDPHIIMGPMIKAESISQAESIAEYYGLIIIGELTELIHETIVKEEKVVH